MKINNVKKTISMQEYQVKSKKKIYKGKSSYLRALSHHMKSSQILDQELTLKDADLKEFWKKFSKAMSAKLPLPIKTDYPDSDLIYLNGFSKDSVQKSWSCPTKKAKMKTKSFPMILSQLSLALQQNTMEEEIIKTRKIRIFPTKNQKSLFKKCIYVSRYFYNKTIDYIKNNPKEKVNFIDIRKKVLTPDRDLKEDEFWQKQVPYDTRQLSIKEAITNYKTNFSKKIKFNMKFKSRKFSSNIFHVNKRALKENRVIFSRILKKTKLGVRKRDKNYLKGKVWGDFKIIQEKNLNWYLILPIKKINNNFTKNSNIVALDPGVRTFQTFFSRELCGKLGDNTCLVLNKYYKKLDNLKSIITRKDINSKKKCNIKKRCNLLRAKIKNIVRDLHWKSANYLCTNFKIILLPDFQTKIMANKNNRKISKKTTRNLLYLSHFLFKCRLKEKAKEYGCIVLDVNEAYTSKTCTICGNIKKINGAKIYSCDICINKCDRDINASRNILIRYFTHLYNIYVKKTGKDESL